MARLLLYHAHPANRKSQVNRAMAEAVRGLGGITFVDLYAEYPRYDIDVDREQARLVSHDVVLMQFPLYWYSTPSILKEWQDLVLEHGFAYGADGDKLAGKTLMLAISAAGPEEAYTAKGYQHFPLRQFLTPLEQTASLCQMRFVAPYVLYGSLKAPRNGGLEPHVAGYRALVEAVRDDRLDMRAAGQAEVLTADLLPIREVVRHG
ncbi:MAG: NAD(P)H-dependent oxidoreductase [Pseudomonadota bacterium]